MPAMTFEKIQSDTKVRPRQAAHTPAETPRGFIRQMIVRIFKRGPRRQLQVPAKPQQR